MAEAVVIRAAYQAIGFTAEAALELTGNQTIDSIAELAELDDGRVQNPCCVLCRPGGGDNGTIVSLRAEENLKLAVYYCKFKVKKTSRQIQPNDITLANIRLIRELKQWEDNHSDPEPPEGNDKSQGLASYDRGISQIFLELSGRHENSARICVARQ